jgi:ParB family transcriptional regulator, chromosome partitioning protein
LPCSATVASRLRRELHRATPGVDAVECGEAGDLVEVATGAAPIVVRANAIRALGKTGGPQETSALVTLLHDRNQPRRIRQEAALALGALRDPAAVTALAATIESDDVQLRISAIQALGALGTADAHAVLARYTPRSPTERAFVARAGR